MSFIHSFIVHSFIHSSIHPSIHLFIYLFIHSCGSCFVWSETWTFISFYFSLELDFQLISCNWTLWRLVTKISTSTPPSTTLIYNSFPSHRFIICMYRWYLSLYKNPPLEKPGSQVMSYFNSNLIFVLNRLFVTGNFNLYLID